MKSMIYGNGPGVVTSQGFMPGRSMYSVAKDSTPSIMGPDVEIGTLYVVLYTLQGITTDDVRLLDW